MTAEQSERVVPSDTLALRLVIARVYAGHHNAASAALACGVSRQNWANWERGKPMRHADVLLPHIAAALGVDESWLRDGGPLGSTAPQPQPPAGMPEPTADNDELAALTARKRNRTRATDTRRYVHAA